MSLSAGVLSRGDRRETAFHELHEAIVRPRDIRHCETSFRLVRYALGDLRSAL
jgi:hypothetical protein